MRVVIAPDKLVFVADAKRVSPETPVPDEAVQHWTTFDFCLLGKPVIESGEITRLGRECSTRIHKGRRGHSAPGSNKREW